MPTYQRLGLIRQREFDANGDPLSGGKLYTYVPGTNTPKGTYQDAEGTPNTNPIILDSEGYCDVFVVLGGGSYKVILTDANDVVRWTEDDVTGSDETEVPTGWTSHAVVAGQAATELEGEELDMTLYSSAIYDVEITRGTTIRANGPIAIQNLNGTARAVVGVMLTLEDHGVTFDCSQVGLVATLRAALSAGSDGTLKMSRRIIPN